MVASKYKIKITPKASNDLNEIYDYITNILFNVKAAGKLMDDIEFKIMRLGDFPLSCSLVNDEILKRKGYRKLIVENYIVFYLVDDIGKQIVIMRVLFGRQHYEELI